MTKLLESVESIELTITPSEAFDIVQKLSGMVCRQDNFLSNVSAGYNGERVAFYIDQDIEGNCAKKEVHKKCTYYGLSMSAAKNLIVHLVNNMDSEEDVKINPDIYVKGAEEKKFNVIISKIY